MMFTVLMIMRERWVLLNTAVRHRRCSDDIPSSIFFPQKCFLFALNVTSFFAGRRCWSPGGAWCCDVGSCQRRIDAVVLSTGPESWIFADGDAVDIGCRWTWRCGTPITGCNGPVHRRRAVSARLISVAPVPRGAARASGRRSDASQRASARPCTASLPGGSVAAPGPYVACVELLRRFRLWTSRWRARAR